jgi:hypothetical protein
MAYRCHLVMQDCTSSFGRACGRLTQSKRFLYLWKLTLEGSLDKCYALCVIAEVTCPDVHSGIVMTTQKL